MSIFNFQVNKRGEKQDLDGNMLRKGLRSSDAMKMV